MHPFINRHGLFPYICFHIPFISFLTAPKHETDKPQHNQGKTGALQWSLTAWLAGCGLKHSDLTSCSAPPFTTVTDTSVREIRIRPKEPDPGFPTHFTPLLPSRDTPYPGASESRICPSGQGPGASHWR
ncbi:hypothetical protein KIL84_014650 [Mauremys mutica]|uniref:Uncharacterized protein n=1 Tax=Mauremys mutica TaxID=74926 RepID=A0A9D4B8H9_9SAUR|nr:hypothetical protein KIL84_014650 [Mauremys mutica]